MAKGYWVAFVDVIEPDGYKQYVAANAAAFKKYGAKFLARGGQAEVMEGKGRQRTVVIEFKDYATAVGCYRSPEYAAAKELRKGKSAADVVIVEGYEGPQP